MNKLTTVVMALLMLATSNVQAGNEDRIGSAGGTQLLVNPWSRSSALANANIASVVGIEGSFLNAAGLAFTRKTEVMFTNTNWMSGSDISINALGFSQRVGESSVLGLHVVSIDFGDLRTATVDRPDGDGSVFTVNNLNIGLTYAKEFSNSIYGGLSVKVISESIFNAKSSGIVFDAGIRYVTGERDNIKFGIALRNVGPPISYTGDGFSIQTELPSTNGGFLGTVEQRSALYELPSLIQIGGAYDFFLSDNHDLTAHGSFTSNAFSQDQFALALEYGFKEYFKLRGGYMLEQAKESEGGGPQSEEASAASFLTGLTAGLSVQTPIGKEGGALGFDYAFRATSPFDGVHSIGVRIDI